MSVRQTDGWWWDLFRSGPAFATQQRQERLARKLQPWMEEQKRMHAYNTRVGAFRPPPEVDTLDLDQINRWLRAWPSNNGVWYDQPNWSRYMARRKKLLEWRARSAY